MVYISAALGSFYGFKKDFGKAISFSKEAMVIFEESDDKTALTEIYKNLVNNYIEIGNSFEAKEIEQITKG